MTLLTLTPEELTTESIAGDAYYWRRSGLRALSGSIDDITRDFGDDLYLRMLLDPAVAATHSTLRAAIIGQGMRIVSAIADPDAEDYALADEIALLCSSILESMTTPLDDVLWDMLMALALGSRVAELVWQYAPASDYYALDGSTMISSSQPILALSAIKPKPREATSFVVDEYMNLVGILPRYTAEGARSLGWFGVGGGPILRASPGGAGGATAVSEDELLPVEKFFIYSYHPANNDPRGMSLYRAAYTPWNLKVQVYPELFKYLAQFASPSIYAILGEKATPVRETQPDGSIKQTRPDQAMLNTLLGFQNGSAAVLPFGTEMGIIQSSGGGEAFFRTFEHCDQQIVLAVLNQTLATLEGEHQSRSAAETHKDTLDLLVQQARRSLIGAFTRDILRKIVSYNYGAEIAARYTPRAELGMVERQDIPTLMTAIAQLARANYLDISQLAGIDALLQLPPRIGDDLAESTAPEPEEQAEEEAEPEADDQEEEE